MITVLRKPNDVKKATANVDTACCGACTGYIKPKDAPVIFVHNGCGMMFFHLECAMAFSGKVKEQVKDKSGDCGEVK